MKLFDEELLVELKLPLPPSANSIRRANCKRIHKSEDDQAGLTEGDSVTVRIEQT
jgi:hypothetical protein